MYVGASQASRPPANRVPNSHSPAPAPADSHTGEPSLPSAFAIAQPPFALPPTSRAGALCPHALRTSGSTTFASALRSAMRSPSARLPHISFSAHSGYSARMVSRSSSPTNTCTNSPSGGMVTKIFPATRNEPKLWCGASVTSGSAIANLRISSSFIAALQHEGRHVAAERAHARRVGRAVAQQLEVGEVETGADGAGHQRVGPRGPCGLPAPVRHHPHRLRAGTERPEETLLHFGETGVGAEQHQRRALDVMPGLVRSHAVPAAAFAGRQQVMDAGQRRPLAAAIRGKHAC